MTTVLQKFEATRQQVESLKNRRTRIQVQVESARQQYTAAAAEAQGLFGTTKIDALKTLLQNKEKEAQVAVDTWSKATEELEAYLSRIEAALENPEAMAALLSTLERNAPALAPATAPREVAAFNEEQI